MALTPPPSHDHALHSVPAAVEQLRSAVGAILQADGLTARGILVTIQPAELDAKDKAFRDCALDRLSGRSSSASTTGDDFADHVLALYRRYWSAAAIHPEERDAEREKLLAGLSILVGHPFADMTQAEAAVSTRLSAVGLHSQLGRTGLVNDLMIWSSERPTPTHVDLPEGPMTIKVVYLDHFASLSWSSYLSCERTGTGGWTTNEASFVIVPSYNSLRDENFRVNLLAHEGQIAADKHRFSGLPAWRLEYRAKLAEVAAADQTMPKVLSAFLHNQGDSSEEPHSYANRHVLRDLTGKLQLRASDQLKLESVHILNSAASELLRQDTNDLERRQQTHHLLR